MAADIHEYSDHTTLYRRICQIGQSYQTPNLHRDVVKTRFPADQMMSTCDMMLKADDLRSDYLLADDMQVCDLQAVDMLAGDRLRLLKADDRLLLKADDLQLMMQVGSMLLQQ